MSDPFTATLAGISLFATAAGTVGQLVGARQQAAATSAAANYQAQVAANNQIIANQQAEAAIQRGQAEAQQQELKNRAQLGGILAAQAASGIDVGTGSARDVQESQRALGRLDTATTEHNAALTAYGYKTQGMNYQAQSGLERLSAQQAQAALPATITGTILGGAGQLSSKWIQFQNAGLFGGGNSSDFSSAVT